MSSQRAGQLVEAGLFLRLSGDLDGARRLFEQALRLDPTNARAKQLLDGAPASSQAPRPVSQPAAPVVPPVGNPAPNRTLSFSPPPVAPGLPAPTNPFEAPSAGGAFDADWGMAMDGAGTDSGWGAPRTTAPVAPMGAPVTTTMAFPLQEARQLPLSQPRAPMGAPPTSTMAYPMGPQPTGEPAPMGAPTTSTMAYPMQPQPAAQPAMPMSTMAFSMAPQPVPELAPMGAPPTSTLAYPMQAQDPGSGHASHTGWTPPPFPRPHDEVAPAQPAPPEPQNWGAPATSTMAYSMAPQPAGTPDEPWAQPPPDPSSWGQHEPAPPLEAHPGWSGQSGQPEPAAAWGQPEPAPAAQGWGAPPTSTLAFPMSAQPPAAPPPVEHDPWAAFKIGSTPTPTDTEAAIWNTVALASPEEPPPSYAPPAVHDPFSAPQPPVAENDWSDVRPNPPTPTAPQGVPTVVAQPFNPPPEPAPEPTRVPIPTPAPLAPRAASADAVPWDAPGPVEPPARPRPQPVAFADWAQPTEAPAPRSSGPWSAGDTPEQPMPAPPSAAPAGLQSLAPMLPAPGVAAPIAEPDEIDDIEVVESDDDALVAQVEAPPPPPPLPPRPLHPFATGIPEPESDEEEGPPGWDDPAMEAAVLDEGDTLDADFSFAPPPPMPAPQAAYVPPPLPPVAFAAPALPAPAPSGPPPIAPGDEPALVTDAQSAWDSNSNPGLKLSSDVAPRKGDPFDLIQKDGQARKAVAPEPDKREVLAGLLRKAKDLIGLDDHTGAMALITQADALAPNDLEVVRLKEKSEATLQRMYESKIGDLNRIPRVKLKETEIIWLNLDHRAGFMLAQVDGASSFEDLFALSGMSRIDTARILAQLIDEGVIVV